MSPRSILLLAMLALMIGVAPSTAHAQWVWRDGPIEYLAGCDANYSPPLCQENGAGFYISQAWDPRQGLPRANTDVFYMKVYMQGIVSGARFVSPYFIPPPGTVLFANPDIAPVRCFYSKRTGGNLIEFTNTTVVDDSVRGGFYVIGGCPRITLQNPYPEADFSGHTGFRIVRNCNYPGAASDCSENWPMASGAAYEFWVPIYVDRAMDGLDEAYRFYWAITMLNASAGISWVYPSLPLYASPEVLPPSSSDMRALLQQGAGEPGRVLVEGLCINGGPNAAGNARCQFGTLPAGAIVECDPPASPVASLPAGASIACSADFPTPPSTVMISLQASSTTTDGITGNNHATVQIIPPATSANLHASLTPGTGPEGFTRVDGVCTNDGPDAASNATCSFTLLPAEASVTCTPATLPVASLASGASIACFAQYRNLTTASTLRLQARSNTIDALTEDNVAALEIPAPPPPASADLRTSLAVDQSERDRTRLLGSCTNRGPDAAANVACSYRGLPAAAAVVCNPSSPQASLAANQSISCSAEFPNQSQTLSVTMEATSPTADPTPTNDEVVVEVPSTVLRDGFESE